MSINNHETVGEAADPTPFTIDERNAMRSFLQRSEVRLSTMHRVAVGFLSGAGLLFLFPVFVKDGVLAMIRNLLIYTPTVAGTSGITQVAGIVLIYLLVLYPFILSLTIPAIALGLLVKDTIRFYFVGHPPTFPEDLFNPRFVLTGIAFSPDESEQVKAHVLRYEYGTDLINFAISRADARTSYYSDLIDKPHRKIVPYTRKLPRLIREGVIDRPAVPLGDLDDDSLLRIQGTWHNETVLDSAYVVRTVKEVDRFNAALGLAGLVDRTLYQEVAKTEVSLVRHALKLRQLVLRYFQALLILIWTSAVTLITLPFLEVQRFPMLTVFAAAYFIWALAAPLIVQLPLYWLIRLSPSEVRSRSISQIQKSDALQRFVIVSQRLCYVALVSSALAMLLELLLQVR